jgi:ferritin
MALSRIPANVLAELNRQLNHELGAANHYLAMSLWCRAQNLKGLAAFFAKQVGEEREHAGKLIAHVIDRNATPELAAQPAPRQDYQTLVEVVQQALAMEQANTKGIHAVFEAALTAKDYPAQVLLHWFINEQVEEEAWAAELVQRVQEANCAGGLSSLDRHIEKLLGGDKTAES